MNEEIKNKIKLISEMLSMYQNTIIKETDVETINLIRKDVASKKIDLEVIKDNLEIELNNLYDNGANEIDPEINQLQIVINEVESLMEDVIPDILMYTKISIQAPKKSLVGEETKVIIESQNKIKEEIEKEKIVEKAQNEIKEKIKKEEIIEKEINIKKEDSKIDDEKVKDEIEQENENKGEKKEKKSGSKKQQKKLKVVSIKPEVVEKEIINENTDEAKKEIKLEENVKNEENDNRKNNYTKNNLKKIKVETDINLGNNDEEHKIILEELVEDDEIPIKTNIKDLFAEKHNNVIKEVAKTPKNLNTIMLKQPTEDYRNTATNIVSNRIKSVNSPQTAIQKSYNASEMVMNNIIEKWKENQ